MLKHHHEEEASYNDLVIERGSPYDLNGEPIHCKYCSEPAPPEILAVFKILPIRRMYNGG